MPKKKTKYVGQSMVGGRVQAFVRGHGVYTDDVELDDVAFVSFLRSPVMHGRITGIEVAEAAAARGVIAVHTGADMARLGKLAINPVLPMLGQPDYPVLASGQVQAVGQPVAAILAETAAIAMDANDLIQVEIDDNGEPPPPEVIARKAWQSGDLNAAFNAADIIVECRIEHARLAPSPMEPRAIAVKYDPSHGSVTIWHSTQTPHRTRSELASILAIDPDLIHVIAPDVGGAFGMKASLYPEEVFTVWAAFHHRRNVKWSATRSEDFLAATHGRGVISHGRLALSHDGRFLGLEAQVEAPLGRWVPNSGLVTAWNAARILPGGYDIETVTVETKAIAENLAPTGIYRGAGRPEANCLMERLVDKAARATGLNPFEIREMNLHPARSLPYKTATGNRLDSGDYVRALSDLKEKGHYEKAILDRDAIRAAGRLAGVGVGFYLEPSGSGWETARVSWQAEGRIEVASGSSTQGHGRETAYAQIAADALQVRPADIDVLCGDTQTCPVGIGALASRSTAIGGSAVLKACEDIRQQLDAGATLPLTSEVRYHNKGQAWGYGCYLIAVEICRDTGEIRINQVTCVDDTGLVVNPAQVNGQISGGFAQGLGEALLEQVVYDENGQLLTGSFMDYALPRAADVPDMDIHNFETPSPMNALGAKGIGEAGTIGAPVAILNAAIDALSPLGIEDINMPLTPQKVWHAIQAAQKDDKK